MDHVSLTYFIDFAMKSGMPKLGVVRDFKEREEYEPVADFYKLVREALAEAHKDPQPKKYLDRFFASVKDENRRKVYPGIIKAYKRFLGRKSVSFFAPPQASWKIGELELHINPELGLLIDDVPHIIKLYFKEGKLINNRIASAVHVMNLALRASAPESVIGILDVRHSKFHGPRAMNSNVNALLEGEAAAFCAMFNALESRVKPNLIEKASNTSNLIHLPLPAQAHG